MTNRSSALPSRVHPASYVPPGSPESAKLLSSAAPTPQASPSRSLLKSSLSSVNSPSSSPKDIALEIASVSDHNDHMYEYNDFFTGTSSGTSNYTTTITPSGANGSAAEITPFSTRTSVASHTRTSRAPTTTVSYSSTRSTSPSKLTSVEFEQRIQSLRLKFNELLDDLIDLKREFDRASR